MAAPIKRLLDREIDRKQFFFEAGGFVLTIAGLGTLARLFADKPKRTSGYGSSTYGGSSGGARKR